MKWMVVSAGNTPENLHGCRGLRACTFESACVAHVTDDGQHGNKWRGVATPYFSGTLAHKQQDYHGQAYSEVDSRPNSCQIGSWIKQSITVKEKVPLFQDKKCFDTKTIEPKSMKDSKKGNTENEIMLDTTLRPFKLEVNMETSDILSKPSDIVCCGVVFQKNTKQDTTSLENGTDEDMESITRTEDNTASDCLCTDHRRSQQIYNLLKSYYDKSGNPQVPFKFQAMQPESEACMSDCSGRIGSDECYKEKESSYGSKFCAPLNDCIASTDQAIERLKEANLKLSISNSHKIESGGPNAVGDPQIQVEKNCCKVIRKCLQPSEDKELKGHAVEVQPVHSVLSQRSSVAQESSQRQREATQGHVYKEKETRVIPKSSHYDEINRQNVIAEIQTFLDDMKHKSSTRLKALEQDTEVQTGMSKMEFEKQRKGMEIIQKLDMKLQDLEEKHFVLPCKQGPQYYRVCKDSHTNPKFMRK